jgi:phage shock protein E
LTHPTGAPNGSRNPIKCKIYNISMGKIVLDVREPDEYAAGHVQGSINTPLSLVMTEDLPANISKDDQVIVYCNSGNRSDLAKQILAQNGYTNVINGINQAYIKSNKL